MVLEEVLAEAVEKGASDVMIVAGLPPAYKLHGNIVKMGSDKLMPNDTEVFIKRMYELASYRSIETLLSVGDDDFSFSIRNLSRFRVNTYKQRGSLAAVIRVISFELPDYTNLNIPDNVMSVASINSGFVLVTGPAASGKSTTLACIIDQINQTRQSHIITLEDPIEYLHTHKMGIVSQREVNIDTIGYVEALRAALRQSPDVILLGEMRDNETIRTAVTAAETGHFVISTLHTVGAADTIDRIIDAFHESQQQQIRIQLSMVLRAVISQQLIPTTDGGIVPAFEVMFVNSAIRNMIRESKTHQIDSAIFSSKDEGMMSMDTSIFELYKKGLIDKNRAMFYSMNKKLMQKKLEN